MRMCHHDIRAKRFEHYNFRILQLASAFFIWKLIFSVIILIRDYVYIIYTSVYKFSNILKNKIKHILV